MRYGITSVQVQTRDDGVQTEDVLVGQPLLARLLFHMPQGGKVVENFATCPHRRGHGRPFLQSSDLFKRQGIALDGR
jgi:hypothetical protein